MLCRQGRLGVDIAGGGAPDGVAQAGEYLALQVGGKVAAHVLPPPHLSTSLSPQLLSNTGGLGQLVGYS